jgi:hypothetical protein
MGLFAESPAEKEEFKIIERLLKNESSLIDLVGRLIPPEPGHQNVKLVFSTTLNNGLKITFMALQLTQGFFSLDQLALIDTDTNGLVAATFANIQPFVSDNPAVLLTAPDPSTPSDPSKCKNTAVSGGTANVTTTADATYTDSVSKVSVTKTLKLSIPYTVVAVTAGENVALTLVQGTPTAVTP